MQFSFHKDEVLLGRIQATHLKSDVSETESAMIYTIDCDIIDTLRTLEEHDTWNIHPHNSIRIYGLATEEEIEELKEFERNHILKIMNLQHNSLFLYQTEFEDLHENLDDEMYYVTAYLHVDETERYIQENIIQFLEEAEMI